MIPILRKVIHHSYKPLLEYYLSSEREYRYKGIRIKVLPGVFHPGFFFSTKILLEFLESFDLESKTLLELGAGTGLISLWARKKGAIATAADISKKAIENIRLNTQLNNVTIKIIDSDLFAKIKQKSFDFIVINPPFYKKNVIRESDYAWHAGEQLEYFQKLFSQIKSYFHHATHAYMILINDCDIGQIRNIAFANNVNMKKVATKRNLLETAFIYRLS